MRIFWIGICASLMITLLFAPPVNAQNEMNTPIFLNVDEMTTVDGSVQDNPRPAITHRRKSLSSRGGSIVQTAHRFIGTPYLWAGTSAAGFDCSGFVMKVFSLNGVNIRRMADEQYYSGTKVKREDLVAGDLVFFTTYGPGVTHVGIYIGDDKFIHSSSRRGVTISSLNESYYKGRFIGGCRY